MHNRLKAYSISIQNINMKKGFDYARKTLRRKMN